MALVYPTSIEFIDAFFGTILAGAVPVPLYPPVRLHRLEEYEARTARMLEAVTARLVLADSRVRRILGPAVAAAEPPLGCRILDDLSGGPGEPVRRGADELAMVQFSSGTTVDPKPVALSHRAVVAQTVGLNAHWPVNDGIDHSGVSWLPLYHDMGLIGCVFTALERPGTLTLIPPELFLARPAVWLRALSTYGATISVAPNFGYGLCCRQDQGRADRGRRPLGVAGGAVRRRAGGAAGHAPLHRPVHAVRAAAGGADTGLRDVRGDSRR